MLTLVLAELDILVIFDPTLVKFIIANKILFLVALNAGLPDIINPVELTWYAVNTKLVCASISGDSTYWKLLKTHKCDPVVGVSPYAVTLKSRLLGDSNSITV